MLAVAALGLVVRIAFQAVVGYETPPKDDAYQYDTVAWSVSQGGEFVTTEGARSVRAPGYPLLLAGVYLVFGHNWLVAKIVQALLGAATCALLVSLGSRLYGATTGAIAGVTYAIFPYAVFWSATLLSEPLCALLALVATWLLLRAENQGWGSLAAWSVACGLTTLTRPNLALLFVFGLPFILFRQPRWFRRGLYVTVIFLLVLLPWTVRNYIVHHRLVFVTTMGGRVLWEGNNPYIAADTENRGRSANAPDLPEARLVTGMDESEADAFYFHLAVDWIRRNPGQDLSLMLHKAIRLWNPAPNLPSRLERWVASFSVICMLVFFLAGLVLALRNRDAGLLRILVPIAAVTLTGLVYWADARIRAPAEPEIALIVATALAGPWRVAVAHMGKRGAAA